MIDFIGEFKMKVTETLQNMKIMDGLWSSAELNKNSVRVIMYRLNREYQADGRPHRWRMLSDREGFVVIRVA